MTLITIDYVQELVFREYRKNGYLDMWTVQLFSTIQEKIQHQSINDIAELGLICSEISEAMENIRKGDSSGLGEECADILIRTLNFMSRKDLNAQTEILKKNETNQGRGILHGRIV